MLNCDECQNEETDSNICTKCKNGKYFARKGVPAKFISEDEYGVYFCPHCSYRGMPFQKIVRDMICEGRVFIYCIRCGGRIRLTSTKDIQAAVKALQSQKADGMSPKQLGNGFKETVGRYKDIDSQSRRYPVTEYARKIGLCDFNYGDAEKGIFKSNK